MMGELSFLYRFVYHLSVMSLIRVLMVGMLPNFRMFSLEMLGRFKTFLMYFVWLLSHMVSAHLTHLLVFLHTLPRCPNCWQFVHLIVVMFMYFLMFVMELPMCILVCSIFLTIFSFCTLNNIMVDGKLPVCFLWMPSAVMFCFSSCELMSWMLMSTGILFMQIHGLRSSLPAR